MSENGRHTAFTTDTKQKPTVLFFEQVRHAAQILADDIEFKVDHRTRFQRMEIGMLIRIRNYANLKSIFCGMAYREAHAVDGHRTFIHTKIAPLHHPGIKSMAESIDITAFGILNRHTLGRTVHVPLHDMPVQPSPDYSSATDEVNSQLAKIDKIVKKYQNDGMVIGEAPMMKDLQDVTDVDLKTVNNISILAIFVIILITFKSISIPVILISIIEFAIACNMAVPFYTNTSLPFVASIVIGTIQLGATVDYAILMTSRYHKERTERGQSKKDAIRIAHETSIKSILTSGLCFFAATFGVSVYSQVDMIGSICTLLSRGAIISMIVVICVLPAMLWIFDGVIKRTSWNMIKANVAKRDAEKK